MHWFKVSISIFGNQTSCRERFLIIGSVRQQSRSVLIGAASAADRSTGIVSVNNNDRTDSALTIVLHLLFILIPPDYWLFSVRHRIADLVQCTGKKTGSLLIFHCAEHEYIHKLINVLFHCLFFHAAFPHDLLGPEIGEQHAQKHLGRHLRRYASEKALFLQPPEVGCEGRPEVIDELIIEVS